MPASMPPADTPNDLAQRESHLFAQVTDLTRRLPPSHVTRNLALLSDALEEFDCRDDIITSVDEPLKVAFDPKKGRQYFQSEYNRDQDSYRSPWSNEFYPPLEEDLEPSLPPKPLRDLEVEFNEAFDVYRDMYFEGGLSCCYLWTGEEVWAEEDPFAGSVLIQKQVDIPPPEKDSQAPPTRGQWDSVHVFEVEYNVRQAHYKLTSTIMLSIERKHQQSDFLLVGSLTRQTTSTVPKDSKTQLSHVANLGKMVEEQEIRLRGSLQEVYSERTKHVVNDLRSLGGSEAAKRRQNLQQELMGHLGGRQKKQ